MNEAENESILRVKLGERSYDILVGEGLLVRAGRLMKPVLAQSRVIIVTDDNVAPLYLSALCGALDGEGINHSEIILPAGEQTKDFAHFRELTEGLLGAKAERDTTLVALGGGVIGDITGFAAAVTLRGLPFIQIPTTLLAQVDSSVGGKTGVDYPGGKNIIGAFHQPRLVLADISTLLTLSAREFRCGIAEVIKYGIISSAPLFNYLEKSVSKITARKKDALTKIVTDSCRIKAGIVAKDERESGVRAVLNMGHTFGHAIETALGFRKLKHGEAVAIGLVMASRLSYSLGLLKAEAVNRVSRLVAEFGLPTSPPRSLDPEDIIKGMLHDKKRVSGKHRFIVFDRIGRASIRSDITKNEILNVLR